MPSNILIKYSLVMGLIQISGNPAVEVLGREYLIVGYFLIAAFFSLTVGFRIPKKAFPLLGAFLLLLLAHLVEFGYAVGVASIGFYLQLLTAMLLMGSIPEFIRYFVRCMFLLALASLPLYFLIQLPGLEGIFAPFDLEPESRKTTVTGFHTFYNSSEVSGNRNSGLMWEPGAFAGYLALALFFSAMIGRDIKITTIEILIIIAALITTLSTMGYIAFTVVAMTYLYRKTSGKNALLFITSFPIALLVLALVVINVGGKYEFLTEKIVRQANEVEDDREKAERNRFGNALYDLDFIAKRPFFGWSANVDTRVELDNQSFRKTKGQGNALTGFAVRFGMIGWLMVMLYFFLGFKAAGRSLAMGFAGVLFVSVLLSSEKFLNYPLLMTLMFITQRHIKLRRRRWRSLPVNS